MPGIPLYQLDANVLVRFIAQDHKDHSPRAAAFIERANRGAAVLCVSTVAVAETFYVMKSVYRMELRKIAKILMEILSAPAFHLAEQARIMDTLNRTQTANVNFVDAYLAAIAAESGVKVASFDRDLDKFNDIERLEP